MRPSLALFVMLLLAPFAAPGGAVAQPQGAQPLDRLLPEVRRSLPGQFLDAEPGRNEGGSPSYRLKWLTPEGRVIWRDIDARTGRVMGPGADREALGRQRPDGARPNFRAPGFEAEEGEAPRGRFGNRDLGARRDFNNEARPAQREFNQDRFNRPGFGDGGERPGRRFGGGDNAEGGRFGGRPFGGVGGGGRGRGRGRDSNE